MPRLTNPMVAAIQGWGPEYKWDFVGRKTSVYRQIGNAFPPPVAHDLGVALKSALQHEIRNASWGAVGSIHDELYMVLRNAERPLSETELLGHLRTVKDVTSLRERLGALSTDFDLEVITSSGRSQYRLGDFRAYRGQAHHPRSIAVQDRRRRSRLS